MVKWNGVDDEYIYEQHDWSKDTEFENVYMYSSQQKHIHSTYMCCVKDIQL